MKSQISYVVLNRAEGPTKECGAVLFYTGDVVPANYDDAHHHYRNAKIVKDIPGNLVYDVLHQFSLWGHTAPERGSGYDKCDFKVVWANGESYEGRFDLQADGYDGDHNFWESLIYRLSYYACTRKPAHFDDADWVYHCQKAEKEGCKASAEKMLNECELG